MIYAGSLPRFLRNAATCTLAWFAKRTASEAAILEFFHIMQFGEGTVNNPPHRLREALLMRQKSGQDTGTRVQTLAWCIIAWNAWLANKPLTRLDSRRDHPFPTVTGLEL